MEKTKYIPGDLVVSKIHGIGVIQVCSLVGKAVIVHYLNDDITVGSSIDSVKPIPLTKEILRKNGWKPDGKWLRFTTGKAYLYIIESTSQKENYLVCVGDDKHYIANISYIHQLQHLLFGLGLDSNLKV